MREIRDQLSLEIMNMSYAEEKAHINKLLAGDKVGESHSDETELPKK
jgi:hypothetical protein